MYDLSVVLYHYSRIPQLPSLIHHVHVLLGMSFVWVCLCIKYPCTLLLFVFHSASLDFSVFLLLNTSVSPFFLDLPLLHSVLLPQCPIQIPVICPVFLITHYSLLTPHYSLHVVNTPTHAHPRPPTHHTIHTHYHTKTNKYISQLYRFGSVYAVLALVQDVSTVFLYIGRTIGTGKLIVNNFEIYFCNSW